MRKIKVAHFGMAHDHSAVTLECARKYPDVFDVVGIVEPDEESRRVFGGNNAYKGIPYPSVRLPVWTGYLTRAFQ